MSWITPTTIWTDSDTPQPSDFNRIEGNTDYLKDSVDNNDSDILSNASSIASVETAVSNNDSDIASNASTIASNTSSVIVLNGTGTPQGGGTTNSPTFGGVTLNGILSPSGGASEGSYTLAASASQVLPRGVYVFGSRGFLKFQVYVGGVWQGPDDGDGGCVFSDGINVRIFNGISSGNITFYYRKF